MDQCSIHKDGFRIKLQGYSISCHLSTRPTSFGRLCRRWKNIFTQKDHDVDQCLVCPKSFVSSGIMIPASCGQNTRSSFCCGLVEVHFYCPHLRFITFSSPRHFLFSLHLLPIFLMSFQLLTLLIQYSMSALVKCINKGHLKPLLLRKIKLEKVECLIQTFIHSS